MNKPKLKINKICQDAKTTNPLSLKPKIYKTIKVINEQGLGTEINFGYSVKQFKCKNGCEHHNHLVCKICGSYSYMDDEHLEDFQDRLAKENGFKPTKHTFQIYGVCQNCQKQKV